MHDGNFFHIQREGQGHGGPNLVKYGPRQIDRLRQRQRKRIEVSTL